MNNKLLKLFKAKIKLQARRLDDLVYPKIEKHYLSEPGKKDYADIKSHGIITPQGAFIPLEPEQGHSEWYWSEIGIPEKKAHEKGYITMSHGGYSALSGHSKVLSDKYHPATQKAKQLARDYYDEKMNIEHTDLPAAGKESKYLINISTQHWAKHHVIKKSEDVKKYEDAVTSFEGQPSMRDLINTQRRTREKNRARRSKLRMQFDPKKIKPKVVRELPPVDVLAVQEMGKSKELGSQEDYIPSDKMFISGDGDGIGSVIEQRVLENDLEGLLQQSDLIQRGQKYLTEAFERLGGKSLMSGGDDNLLLLDKEYIDEIEPIRQGYNEATQGFTITLGVGNEMREAVKALVYGKLTGKNKTVFWNDKLNQELERLAKPQTQEEKMKEHGLLGDDISKVQEMFDVKPQAAPKKELTQQAMTAPKANKPITVRGELVKPNPHIKSSLESKFDNGTLHTPKGSFKIQLPHEDEHKIDLFGGTSGSNFDKIIDSPDIQRIHSNAMNNWQKMHKNLKSGKVPDDLIAHAAIFTTLSANNAVPMQELTYSRLVDTMKQHNVDPKSFSFKDLMERGGKLREAWRQSDVPTELPEHSREYWQGEAGKGITQQNPSDITGRKKGDIYKLQYIDAMGDKLKHYPEFHKYLTDLVKKHKANGQTAISQMMKDKVDDKIAGAGMGSKIARYFYSMLGSGNIHVPDTHLIRHLFGLDSKKDTETHKHLKSILWNPKNHELLNKIDEHYNENYPTVKYVQDKYFGGKKTPDATFPAFWLHWLAIAPHEKSIGIGKPHGAKQSYADHTPFWDKANEILKKHGFGQIEKSEDDDTPVYARSASAMHDLYNEIGPSASNIVFYSEIAPYLMKDKESKGQVNQKLVSRAKRRLSELYDMVNEESAIQNKPQEEK